MAVPKWLSNVAEIASAASPLAELASPIVGLFGSLLGGSQQAKNVRDTNATNLQIARENNSAQERMLFYNNAFNKQAAIDMFNMENEYNSPANQRALMIQGGFNPATMYQNGAQVARSDASTPQAASSGITPTMPNLTPPPSTIGAMFGNFESLTRAMSNIANSKLSEAQKDRIMFLVGEEFNNMAADTAWKNAQSDMQRIQARFEKEFGKINRQTDLGLKVSQIWDNFQAACLKATQGELNEAQKLYTESMKDLNNLDYKIKDESKDWLVKETEQAYYNAVKEGKRIDSATNLNNASAANQSSQARLNNEQASQLEDIHDFVVNIKKNEDYIKDKEATVKFYTYMSEVGRIINEAEKSGFETKQAQENLRKAKAAAEMAEKENSSYYWRIALDALGDVVQGAATVYGLKFLGKGIGTKKLEPKLDTNFNSYQRYHPENGLYY